MNRKIRSVLWGAFYALFVVVFSLNDTRAYDYYAFSEETNCVEFMEQVFGCSSSQARSRCNSIDINNWDSECLAYDGASEVGMLGFDSAGNMSCPDIDGEFSSLLSCAVCPNGYERVGISDLLLMREEDNFEFSNSSGWEVSVWEACNDYGDYGGDRANCGYGYYNLANGDLDDYYVCVQCKDVDRGIWTTYNGNVVRRQLTGGCYDGDGHYYGLLGYNGTRYEYGCKAGSLYVNGYGTSINCSACPTGANCATTPGHTSSSIVSCKAGYYKSGNSCVACPQDTYQSSSSFTGSSCTSCPNPGLNWADPDDEDDIYGRTVSTGSTSVTQCYLENGSYIDNAGTFNITQDQSCFYVN